MATDTLQTADISERTIHTICFLAAGVNETVEAWKAAVQKKSGPTMLFSGLTKLLDHLLTDRGLEQFLADGESTTPRAKPKQEGGLGAIIRSAIANRSPGRGCLKEGIIN